ncbi:MAG TPA: hypothetical protein PK867_24320 [Pirellulales bacterium]|nr:hypothetical protein [Pirellulales bacterium]
MADAFVGAKLQEAWKESNPHAPEVGIGKPGSTKIEQGGWIIWNKRTGELDVVRVAAGSRDGLASIVGSRPEDSEDHEVLAWFPTHPNKVSEGYAADPSPADIAWQASEANVPGIIETHEGRKLIPYA